jgi:peptidoglycan/xylan/chitin deacetylase (PgdA/CDA1 family)
LLKHPLNKPCQPIIIDRSPGNDGKAAWDRLGVGMLRNYKFQMLRSITKRMIIQSSLGMINLLQLPKLMPASGGRGVIFTLHHVRPDMKKSFDPNAHLSITPEFLNAAIRVAKDAGLVPVPLDALPRLLADPQDVRKFVCYTLDDGYRDNLHFAAPVFRSHSVPYTVFVTPGFVDRGRTIWWETLEKLLNDVSEFSFDFGSGPETVFCVGRDAKITAFDRIATYVETASEDLAVAQIDKAANACGIDAMAIVDAEIMTRAELGQLLSDPLASLGAHTMTHPNLARVCVERLCDEMRQSADAISKYQGRPVTTFSYPYGGKKAVSARETQAAKDHGFAVAVTTQPGVLTSNSLNQHTAMHRVPLNGYYQRPNYVRALISGLPFRFA